MGIWEHLGDGCLYERAEWVKTRDLILGNLIHALELIEVTALWSIPICLYREAMHLQCFPPTRYLKNREYPWCALFRNYQIWSIGCFFALYGSTMHPRCIVWFSGQYFFLLSMHASLKRVHVCINLYCIGQKLFAKYFCTTKVVGHGEFLSSENFYM